MKVYIDFFMSGVFSVDQYLWIMVHICPQKPNSGYSVDTPDPW